MIEKGRNPLRYKLHGIKLINMKEKQNDTKSIVETGVKTVCSEVSLKGISVYFQVHRWI